MDCSGIADHLSPLLDGELEGEKAESVRAHLAQCPRCRKAFQDHGKVKRLLSEKLFLEQAPARLKSAILDRLDSLSTGDFFSRMSARLRARPRVVWSTAAVLLAGVVWSVLQMVNHYHLPPLLLELAGHHAETKQPPLEVVSADPGEVARTIGRMLNREVGVADLKSQWCFLIGARRCPACRNAAEVRYLHPAGSFSYFLVWDAGEKAIRKLRKLETVREERMDGGECLCCNLKCGRTIFWWQDDDIFAVRSGPCLPYPHLLDIAGEIRKTCSQEMQ
jgi:mycothiol system anti-sigma-R factor